ncbi:FGGY-family carbohydrate kinase [Hungatella hathewayi]|uniref:FGGY-family carbohydrate kinase n=1 Tax=Hungatella hathewayi TaxID=154046 RepID=UPI003562573D
MNVLVIDVGTSSMRGILYDAHATELKKIQISYSPFYIDQIRVEQNASDWTSALIQICSGIARAAKEENLEIDVLSLTSQRSSVLPLSKDMEPLSPAIMWQDKRTVPLCRTLESHNPAIIKKTGSRINPVYSGSKMAWIRKNQPELFDHAAKLAVIPDYLVWLMTGRLITDHTYGSRSLLMNLKTREWDEELLRIFGLPRSMLCDLVSPGAVAGQVSGPFSRLTGLLEGTPLISAGGDQQCSALGLGVLHHGDAQVTAGTGAYIISGCDELPAVKGSEVIVGASAIPGKYILESSILACCSAFNWFHNAFYPEDDRSFELINQEILNSPPAAGGIIALPYFQGQGTPDWNSMATASILNLTLSSSRGDMARAVLEGVCYEIKVNMECMAQYLPAPSSIVLSGGLTKCPALSPSLSGILETPVTLYSNPESTALGAWMSAAVTTGLYSSWEEAFRAARASDAVSQTLPENRDNYKKGYSLYQESYSRLYPYS